VCPEHDRRRSVVLRQSVAHAGLAQSDGLAISILFGAASFIVGLVDEIAYGSPTVYSCDRSKKRVPSKSMEKPYDDDTDFTCVRRVVWKASAPLTSELFGAAKKMVALNSSRLRRDALASKAEIEAAERTALFVAKRGIEIDPDQFAGIRAIITRPRCQSAAPIRARGGGS
jgi:hypothetical protein